LLGNIGEKRELRARFFKKREEFFRVGYASNSVYGGYTREKKPDR